MQNKNYNQPELTVQEQTKVRIEKLDKLKEKGVEPFGSRFDVKDKICDLKAKYADKTKEELEEAIELYKLHTDNEEKINKLQEMLENL